MLSGAAPASPSPDPKAKASAVRFAMDGQSPVTPKATKPAGAIAKRCKANGIPEVAETMAFNGVVAVEEAAMMSDAEIEALCAAIRGGQRRFVAVRDGTDGPVVRVPLDLNEKGMRTISTRNLDRVYSAIGSSNVQQREAHSVSRFVSVGI